MKNVTPEHDLVLEQTTHWYQSDAHTFVSCVFDINDPDGAFEEQEVSTTRLGAIDPRLPELLTAMIAYRRQQKELSAKQKGLYQPYTDGVFAPRAPQGVSGKNVRETLKLMRGSFIEFTDTENRINIVTTANLLSQDRSDFVRLTGTTVETDLAYLGDTAVRFVIASRRLPHMVYLAELDDKYPGWQQRWEVAQTLHDEITDVVSQVFITARIQAEPPTMPDLTFE